MTSHTYPASLDVSAGQPTSYLQYNRLRGDALRFGAAESDAVPLGRFLAHFSSGIQLSYLGSNRLRINHNPHFPPSIMIGGYMCQVSANVDLASNSFSGPAADWYIFANRVSGSSTFTLSVNTSSVEGPDQRVIGECRWDGSALDSTSIQTYQGVEPGRHLTTIVLNASITYTSQTSYTSNVMCHQRIDFGLLKLGAKTAYLVANMFTSSATGYVRFYDSTNASTIVEISTTATTGLTMVKSGDILSALPSGEVETRFEYKTSGSRVDCYWGALILEY